MVCSRRPDACHGGADMRHCVYVVWCGDVVDHDDPAPCMARRSLVVLYVSHDERGFGIDSRFVARRR